MVSNRCLKQDVVLNHGHLISSLRRYALVHTCVSPISNESFDDSRKLTGNWILKLYLVTFNACMVVFINRTVQYTTQKCLKK